MVGGVVVGVGADRVSCVDVAVNVGEEVQSFIPSNHISSHLPPTPLSTNDVCRRLPPSLTSLSSPI